MIDLETWHTENGRYLAASLHWLRLRLTQLARQYEPRPAPLTPEPTMQPPGHGRRAAAPGVPLLHKWWHHAAEAAPDIKALPDGVERQLEQRMHEAAEARAAAARMQPPPALVLLGDQLRLTPFERDIMLLCAGMELDTRIPTLCAQAMGTPEQTYPTYALALSLFEDPSWDALSPQRPLRYWRLIDVQPTNAQPLTARPLHADERIVHYIKGANALDERLSLLIIPVEESTGAKLPPSQRATVDAILAQWECAGADQSPPVAVILGSDAGAKLLVAQQIASTLRRQLYRIGMDVLPAPASEVEWLARLWQRESALLPLALYVDAQVDNASPEAYAGLDRFVTRAARSNGVLMLGSREPLPRMSFGAFTLDVQRPTPSEQRAEWLAALSALNGALDQHLAGRLAGQFSLNTPEIQRIVQATPTLPLDTLPERLWDACRERTRPRLDTLAQRIDPRATWDDLVIIEDTLRILQEIVAQVEHRSTVYESWGFAHKMTRGLGISALFTGESGTGKTLAAEVIASALRLALYRIDLSQVVSKYIGETEKNLQRVFDVMEAGGAILFFDEADALFGKRSEVRDSHDRYANIEINYLLQRMESYTGLAILATNLKSALDPAFLRRLRFIAPFSFPSPAERRLIWEKAFPASVPQEPLDYERLARLNLSGASIHSIALSAAFLAAKTNTAVTMALVLMAARTEFRKLERPISEAELKA